VNYDSIVATDYCRTGFGPISICFQTKILSPNTVKVIRQSIIQEVSHVNCNRVGNRCTLLKCITLCALINICKIQFKYVLKGFIACA